VAYLASTTTTTRPAKAMPILKPSLPVKGMSRELDGVGDAVVDVVGLRFVLDGLPPVGL